MKFLQHLYYPVIHNIQEELNFKLTLLHAQIFRARKSRQKRPVLQKRLYLELYHSKWSETYLDFSWTQRGTTFQKTY